MSTSQIKELEENIKGARKLVDLGTALERLKANKDFRTLVTQGYFENEAVRLVHAKSNPSLQSPEMQSSILTQIDAIGNLNRYFMTITQQAAIALKSIKDDEQAREEILEEDE